MSNNTHEDKYVDVDDMYNDDENADTDERKLEPVTNNQMNEDDDDDEDLEQFIQNDDCEDGDSIDETTVIQQPQRKTSDQ